MDDTTITIPAPFEVGEFHNRINCLICGKSSYASEFFGDKVDDNVKSTRVEWIFGMIHLNHILSSEDMRCPKCGARENGNLGRRIINFMVSEMWG